MSTEAARPGGGLERRGVRASEPWVTEPLAKWALVGVGALLLASSCRPQAQTRHVRQCLKESSHGQSQS